MKEYLGELFEQPLEEFLEELLEKFFELFFSDDVSGKVSNCSIKTLKRTLGGISTTITEVIFGETPVGLIEKVLRRIPWTIF